ncbi:hypothetical protein [Roseateles cellulosilyticus]|uniref:hypothetical protein n=1 Tax=Pelomonas cellulosilytica TaxID=2906762 RepID=UPI0032C247AE
MPAAYFLCVRAWTALGVPAFFALVAVFYLMSDPPTPSRSTSSPPSQALAPNNASTSTLRVACSAPTDLARVPRGIASQSIRPKHTGQQAAKDQVVRYDGQRAAIRGVGQ